jgi:DNA invertase Pin-like site-specific DNA recombinase
MSNDTEKTGYINLDMRDVRTGDLDGNREFDLWDLCEECMKEIRDFVKQKSDNKPKATIKRPISADTKYAAITPERVKRIKELVREGKTVKEIAELVGVSDPTVRKYKAEVAIETSDCLSESDQKVQ